MSDRLQLLDALLAPLRAELTGAPSPAWETAVRCRLARLRWDLYDDRTAAEALLSRTPPTCGPAVELRRQLLLDQGEAEAAAQLLEDLAAHPETPAEAAQGALEEAAIIYLFWLGRPVPAAAAAKRARTFASGEARADELLDLALAVSADVETLAERALLEGASPSTMLAAATGVWDRLGRAEVAIDLLRKVLETDPDDLLVIELLLELAGARPQKVDRAPLLKRKLDLLGLHSSSSPEVAALRFEVGRQLTAARRLPEAAELLSLVEPEGNLTVELGPSWADILLWWAKRDLAAQQGDLGALITIYGELSRLAGAPAMARAYRLRLALLLDASRGDHHGALALAEQSLHEQSSDPHAAALVERFRLQGIKPEELLPLYSRQQPLPGRHRGRLLRQAAVLVEAHHHDISTATALRRDGLALLSDPHALGDLERYYRAQGLPARLFDCYRQELATARDPELVAQLCGAMAALRFAAGDLEETERLTREALTAVPDDPLALPLLGLLLKDQRRSDELETVLRAQAQGPGAPANRAAALRALAALASEPVVARHHLEQAYELHPTDLSVLRELAQLHETGGAFTEAVSVWRRLAEAAGDPREAAGAYLEQARVLKERLGQPYPAVQACRRAAELDPASVPALSALQRLYLEQENWADLEEILERLLVIEERPDARLGLLLSLGEVYERADREPDRALRTYAQAARSDPTHPGALARLERLARSHEAWALLVNALESLPPAVPTLELLAEALAELRRLPDLAEVRAQLLALAQTGPQRADRHAELADVLEQLGDPDALLHYQRAVTEFAQHLPALHGLQRLYQRLGDYPGLRTVVELELGIVTERNRRAELLLLLGRCLSEEGDLKAAMSYLEQALALRPDGGIVLQELSRLYRDTFPRELAQVMRQRAEGARDEAARASYALRTAELLAEAGDFPAAWEAYFEAFRTDPANRQVFTLVEGFCLQRHLWTELLMLYDLAIGWVEEGGDAYRPGDLYTRRGQVLLTHLNQPGEAASSYLRALEHDPKSAAVLKALQGIYAQQQDWRGLIEVYERRAGLMPDNELFQLECYREAARIASARLPERDSDTVDLWEEVLRREPTDDEAQEQLERAYRALGKQDRLVDLLQTRLTLAPPTPATLAKRLELASYCETELEDPGRAAQLYESAREIDPRSEPALRALARIYEATSQWESCAAVLRDLIQVERSANDRSLLYFKCGSIFEARFGNEEEAITLYRASLHESPGCIPALQGLRDLHQRRGDWEEVLQTLELERKLWDGPREQAGVLTRMAEIRLRQLRDPEGAAALYDRALAAQPDYEPALLALFNLSVERDDHERALRLASRLASRMGADGDAPRRSQFFARKGQLLARTQPAEAAQCLVQALELNPGNNEALAVLVDLCRSTPDGYDFAAAISRLLEQLKADGNRRGLSLLLVAEGLLAQRRGEAERAVELYQQARQAGPDELLPAQTLAELHLALQQPHEAVAVLEDLATHAPTELRVRALTLLGDAWSVQLDDAQRAAEAYSRALDLAPDDVPAAFGLAQASYVAQDFAGARATMEALVQRASSLDTLKPSVRASLEHYLGVTLLRTGARSEALVAFRRALQQDPLCVEAALSFAAQLVEKNDGQGAEELLSHTLHELNEAGRRADAVGLRRGLGRVQRARGRLRASQAEYAALVDSSDGDLADRIVLAELQAADQRDLGGAIQQLHRLVVDDGVQLAVLPSLAEVYRLRGDEERAGRVLRVWQACGGLEREDDPTLQGATGDVDHWPTRCLDAPLWRLLAPPLPDARVEQLWEVVCEPLERLFPLELADDGFAADEVGDETFSATIQRALWVLGFDALVEVAPDVPGGVLADPRGRPRIVLDQVFLTEAALELAFVVARSAQLLMSGHALVARLAAEDRRQLAELLAQLLRPPAERSAETDPFLDQLPPTAVAQIDEIAAAYQRDLRGGSPREQPARWLGHVERTANHAGLVACGDIAAALRMMALLSDEELASGPLSGLATSLTPDGSELIQYYLSETYDQLRRRLGGSEPHSATLAERT
ncbi:MAG: tetratricopeptide repeat protein [Deltaproteobacteria bacterium]|nr:tetratricopeptide repeat protein [Deltaproteobacteria bacterium]